MNELNEALHELEQAIASLDRTLTRVESRVVRTETRLVRLLQAHNLGTDGFPSEDTANNDTTKKGSPT
jgi:hypothetical protein